jgi:hypothetical protein
MFNRNHCILIGSNIKTSDDTKCCWYKLLVVGREQEGSRGLYMSVALKRSIHTEGEMGVMALVFGQEGVNAEVTATG